MLTALIAAVVALGAFVQWVVRVIVRQELEVVKQDITVLRAAVFNHLTHGERPEEAAIRKRLGYGER